jgi:hypothetical protein
VPVGQRLPAAPLRRVSQVHARVSCRTCSARSKVRTQRPVSSLHRLWRLTDDGCAGTSSKENRGSREIRVQLRKLG